MNSQLESALRHTRVQPITPRSGAPAGMDFNRVRRGFHLLEKHNEYILRIMATSGLGSIFAARDVSAVMVQTGVLLNEFSPRLDMVLDYMDVIMHPRESCDEFVAVNLSHASKLGMVHVGVARHVDAGLNWDHAERVPISQQAFCLVLYGFAWWPIEALVATGQIDLESANEELEGWFHLWSVIGYAMGLCGELLPANFACAKEIATLLREIQHTGAHGDVPEGVPVLLGGQMRWLLERPEFTEGLADLAPQQALLCIAGIFADAVKLSPGLSEALGLGNYPGARLIRYALTLPVKSAV